MMKTGLFPHLLKNTAAGLFLLLMLGCGIPAQTSPAAISAPISTPPDTSTPTVQVAGLSGDEVRTLSSLEKVDDYPLYTLEYYAPYDEAALLPGGTEDQAGFYLSPVVASPTWGCSLFAALGFADARLYGRNFDWEYSPAVLVFTHPADGYASVSMVALEFLGLDDTRAGTLTDVPLADRQKLLHAPYLPFDGMNEYGLSVGMAAVPAGNMQDDPDKKSIGSILIIRRMLDHAKNVDEAVIIFRSYKIDMAGGPPIHYLIADAAGRAALLEFYQGKLFIISNDKPWHLATNFLRSSVGDNPEGQCWRYDTLSRQLANANGQMEAKGALDLLAAVAQDSTQWSVVYGMSSGDIRVVMGKLYNRVHEFHLPQAGR